jgi:LIVCS family branched-chain amino acid:cation transporter
MPVQEQSLPTQKNKSNLFTTGLALFSMFFGAGNLIFPLLIGQSVGQNVWFAILGLGLTAVAIPLLGLVTMVLFRADYHLFFGRLGKVPGALLLLLLQLILGPFGVIPRLVTLMHATAEPYLFGMSLFSFSVLVAGVILACSFKKDRLISFLGAYLTPVLLLSLAALVFFGLTDESSLGPTTSSPCSSFLLGLFGGYNSMDLIAAFLFSTLVLPHFQKAIALEDPMRKKQSLLKKVLLSSLIAASLLFITDIGLCLVSAHHGWTLETSCPPQQILGAISMKILGTTGGCIAAIAVITACLTTALTLTAIFAEYLQKDLCKNRISPMVALILTLGLTTLFANLGFSGIAAFLSPILQIVYPGLILLTLLNLFHALYGYRRVKLPTFLIFAGSTVMYLYN